LLLLVLNLVTTLYVSAQPAFQWAGQLGGAGGDFGNSIAVDGNGNVYTTGYFSGTADFDPGSGVSNMTSAGGNDVFISKLDASGNFVWAKRIGGGGNDYGYALTVDAIGNVFTTGYFDSIADFDPGTGTMNLTPGGYDIFISKLDAAGNYVWAVKMGGLATDYGNSIALDGNGNVLTTGYFNGIADFDPGSGVYNMTSAGGNDVFVSKLTSAGNFIWAKQMGGGSNDISYSIAVDGDGNVHTCGYYFSTAGDFDPGPGTYILSPVNSADIFISKLDSSGGFLWAKSMGGSNNEIGYELALDAAGNVHTTGYFNATVDFDPSGATFNITSSGLFDVFISKLDASGNFVWAKKLGGSASEAGYSLVVDGLGNVYTVGGFEGTCDFDPGGGVYNLSPTSAADVFVSKLDPLGNFVCAGRMGGSGGALGYDIVHDGNFSIHVTGYFTGTTDFDPGTGTANLTPGGTADAFVCKLSDCSSISVAEFHDTGITFLLYPNPSEGEFILETDAGGELSIFNSMGQKIIYQEIMQGNTGFDLRWIPKGVYYILLNTDQGTGRGKVVIE